MDIFSKTVVLVKYCCLGKKKEKEKENK